MDSTYQQILPITSISDFVEKFWVFENNGEEDKAITILPDGCFELLFTFSELEPLTVSLLKLQNEPSEKISKSKSVIYSISFKLVALEYIFKMRNSDFKEDKLKLPENFWDINKSDLTNFENFVNKATSKIKELTKENIDVRKQNLFQLVYASKGSMTVKKLSEKVFWSSRLINLYFNYQFGFSLKSFCNLLRFQASFSHLKEGKLYPEQDYTDQNHFIKEVKKFSGVVPKELFKNDKDRFIHFTILIKKK
jgi:AraC-like DNA-binding protein